MVDVSGFFTLLVSKNLLPLDLYLSLSHSFAVCLFLTFYNS